MCYNAKALICLNGNARHTCILLETHADIFCFVLRPGPRESLYDTKLNILNTQIVDIELSVVNIELQILATIFIEVFLVTSPRPYWWYKTINVSPLGNRFCFYANSFNFL